MVFLRRPVKYVNQKIDGAKKGAKRPKKVKHCLLREDSDDEKDEQGDEEESTARVCVDHTVVELSSLLSPPLGKKEKSLSNWELSLNTPLYTNTNTLYIMIIKHSVKVQKCAGGTLVSLSKLKNLSTLLFVDGFARTSTYTTAQVHIESYF